MTFSDLAIQTHLLKAVETCLAIKLCVDQLLLMLRDWNYAIILQLFVRQEVANH